MKKINVLGVGDLVVDHYYSENLELTHTSLGGSVFNSITLLNKSLCNRHFALYYGEDMERKFTTHCTKFGISKGVSLKLPQNNKTFNISVAYEDVSTLDRTWYNVSKLDFEDVIRYTIDEDIDVVLFDTLKKENIELSKKLRRMGITAFADISYICMVKEMDSDELLKFLTDSFDYLQLNKEAYVYISDKLSCYANDLVKLLKLKVLSVTDEKQNVFLTNFDTFVYDVKTYLEAVVDSTGAGDAFFSVFVETMAKNNFLASEKVFSTIMNESSERILPIIQRIGVK